MLNAYVHYYGCKCVSCVVCVVFVGREGCGDALGPEWDTLDRRRAGPLPSVCTAGLLPAFQPRAGHLCLVTTHTHAHADTHRQSLLSFTHCESIQQSAFSYGCKAALKATYAA